MKTISMTLDVASIDRAIAELERYRNEFPARIRRLREMIAERIKWTAQNGFDNAMGNDIIIGELNENNYVHVFVANDDTMSIVIADGKEAIFIEFGAGVWHNGPAGDSPHPWGVQMGYAIGNYLGQMPSKGVRNAWNIPGGAVTRGTPAEMPMYRGAEEAIRSIEQMVREVFGND